MKSVRGYNVLIPLAALLLAGCSSAAPVDTGTTTSNRTKAEQQVERDDKAPASTTLEATLPDPTTLPDWIPDDLPMPVGKFEVGADYKCGEQFLCEYGYSLMFLVESYEVAETLAADLEAYGHVETDYNEFSDGARRVRFTEGPKVRANVAIDNPSWTEHLVIEYNIEPQGT